MQGIYVFRLTIGKINHLGNRSELADAELFEHHANLLDLPDDTRDYLTLAGAQLLGAGAGNVLWAPPRAREAG